LGKPLFVGYVKKFATFLQASRIKTLFSLRGKQMPAETESLLRVIWYLSALEEFRLHASFFTTQKRGNTLWSNLNILITVFN
jgi:hypothetical protein